MNIGIKAARHLLDALIHMRKALAIAQASPITDSKTIDVNQLALERCIEIADEALQREGLYASVQMDEALILNLSKLRYLIARDYHLVDQAVLRNAALQLAPDIISKIEPLEEELYRIAQLKKPPSSP